MLDESQSKIAELETKTRQLQARHDAFEARREDHPVAREIQHHASGESGARVQLDHEVAVMSTVVGRGRPKVDVLPLGWIVAARPEAFGRNLVPFRARRAMMAFVERNKYDRK